MKKTFLLFTAIFLFSGSFLASPKSVSADPGLLAEMVRDQASDACINNIALASIPLSEDFNTSNYGVSLDDEDTFTIVEDEDDTFTIIEDEGIYTRTVEESNNAIMPFSVSTFKNQVATSSQGSKIIMPIGQFTNYGYCHTFKGHMLNANGNKKYSKTINGEKKSQFQYPRYPETTMDIIIEVVNGTKTLTCQKDKPTRCTKEAYSDLEDQKVKVVLERGKNFSNYNTYEWVVITAYPKF